MNRLRSGVRMGVVGVAVTALALVAAACGSSKKAATTPTTLAPAGGSATTLAPAASSTPTAATQLPAKYQAAGLTVAMDASYPPDEFIKSGQIVGFDADLIKAIGAQLGVKVKLTNATFNTIIPGLV